MLSLKCDSNHKKLVHYSLDITDKISCNLFRIVTLKQGMLMGTNSALLISPHGLDLEEQNTLKTALQSLATDGVYFQVQNQNVQAAHLVIVDDESEHGLTVLEQARAGQVKLVFSSLPRKGKNLVSVKKPIDLTNLKDILSRVFRKMQAQLSQRSGQIAQPAPSSTATGTDVLEKNLFVTLLEAKEKQQLLKITFPEHPVLHVNGQSRSFACDAEHDAIKLMSTVPFAQLEIEYIVEEDFSFATQGNVISALYRILWVAGVHGSQGKLLPGHDDQRPVKLRAWPNFTRNDFLPQHLKIAAVLARQPTTLQELQQQTQLNRDDIINFYNAAYAVDLIETNAEATAVAESAPVERPVSSKRKGILAKLAARLKLGA